MATVKVKIRVTIGEHNLNAINAIKIESSRRNIADTAVIQLPIRSFNRYNDAGKLIADGKINIGDFVTISIGYIGYDKAEFVGYVSRISKGTPGVICCEDRAWLFKQKNITKVWNEPIRLQEVVNFVSKEYNTTGLGAVPELTFEKFRIENKTGYEFLQVLKEQWGLTSYFRNESLFVELIPTILNEKTKFAHGVNICGNELKKRAIKDNKVQIKLKSYQKDNTYIEATAGEAGGSVIEKIKFDIDDKNKLKEIAETELAALNIDGYEGSFETWLFQPVKHSSKIEFTDADEKAETYLVDSVNTKIDGNGCKQTITVGKLL